MKNKLRIFIILAIMLAFTGANAQYTGGDGPGRYQIGDIFNKAGE